MSTVASLPAETPSARFTRSEILVWAIAGAAITLAAYFDLQTDVALVDEWARRWTLIRLFDGHGFALWGTNPGLVQLALAAPLAALHLPPRTWRLTGLPFLVMAAIYTYRLCRLNAADRFWSAVGGAVLICCPVTLVVATGIMNETVFLGLFAAAIYYSLVWIEEDHGQLPAVAFTLLATLQRPQGAVIALGVAAAMLYKARFRLPRRQLGGLGALMLGVAVAYRGPALLPHTATLTADPPASMGDVILRGVAGFPVMLGLMCLPLLWALATRSSDAKPRWTPLTMAAAILISAALVASIIFAIDGSIFPGEWFGSRGVGPVRLAGKAAFWPALAFLAVELATTVCYMVIGLWRRGAWGGRRPNLVQGLLIFCAVSQMLPVLVLSPDTRYFLMVLLPLVPLVVAMIGPAAGVRRGGRAWAVAALLVGTGGFAAGEQDFLAGQVALDSAAAQAYARYAPWQVAAGPEEAAQHVWIPYVDAGRAGRPKAVDGSPRVVLSYARPDDPRPGVTYRSLVPGRVVITECQSASTGSNHPDGRSSTYPHCGR